MEDGVQVQVWFYYSDPTRTNGMHPSRATQIDAQVCASSNSVRGFYPVNAEVKPESHLSDFPARNETSETVAQVSL